MERGHLAFLLLFLLLLPSICECLSYVEPMEESLKDTGVENGRARTNAYVVLDIHERDGTKCVTAVKDFGGVFKKEEFCCIHGSLVDLGSVVRLKGNQKALISVMWILFTDSVCSFKKT